MIAEESFIHSVEFVRKEITERHGVEFKDWKVRQVMKSEMGMSFKKVVPIAWRANSDRNLILRQQFALSFLAAFRGKYTTIINVDETWLGMSDFRRMKWRPRGHSNSVP